MSSTASSLMRRNPLLGGHEVRNWPYAERSLRNAAEPHELISRRSNNHKTPRLMHAFDTALLIASAVSTSDAAARMPDHVHKGRGVNSEPGEQI